MLAVVWFGAAVFLAPVLLLTSLVGVVRSGSTRGVRRRERTRDFAFVGVVGLVLLAGLPVWLATYAQ